LNAILDVARAPVLLEVAPLLPEAIELAVEAGLRKEGLFRLTVALGRHVAGIES